MEELKLVYSFTERSPSISVIIFNLFFVVIGLGIYFYFKIRVDKKSPSKTQPITYTRIYGMIFGIVFALFGGVIGAFVITSNMKEYNATKKIYYTKSFQIVRGRVENYHPMPEGGHDTERFTVDGVAFEYSDYDESDYGYNNAASKGGVIREGLLVRISYFNNGDKNVILQLETE